LFGKKTPHEQYGQKINDAGLKETALGRLWFNAAEQSLSKPLSISTPYSEAGYFAADRPVAAGFRFQAKRGQKLNITLQKKPAAGFLIYMDLWQVSTTNNKPDLLVSADTTNPSINYEVKKDGSYIVRLQPELLKSGEYTLSISTGPSLAFPVTPKAKAKIGSYWGADRDGGARKHEGIDIFAPSRTPLVAAADGRIERVQENNIGGKVVWLRPEGKDYTLYYAHLDEQTVSAGQSVKEGETVGLMGNTGNARTTPPHLHFGIYAQGGAVDPLAFVNPVIKTPEKITAPLAPIGKLVRSDSKVSKVYGEPVVTPSNYITVDGNTLLQVEAASANWYKVVMPDGQQGYIQSASTSSINTPIKKITVTAAQPLFDAPDYNAPRITSITSGKTVNVLASFRDFYYIRNSEEKEGWISKKP
jgi:murein DD-endopeptidase MepM/ murein hydrolase activator NlpD